MYSDISVTASSTVVRDMDKAFAVMNSIPTSDVEWVEVTESEMLAIILGAMTIEKLFLWEEDQLFEYEEYGLILCRVLPWYRNILELLRDLGEEEPRSYIRKLHEGLMELVSGIAVDSDYYDQATDLCLAVSEAIWSHFTFENLKTLEEA